MTDFNDVFSFLSPEDLGLLLENEEVSIEKEDSGRIAALAFEKAEIKRERKKTAVFVRVLAAAACLCLVSCAAVFGVRYFSKPQTEPVSTTLAASPGEKALMLAISNGDEGLIEKLLKSGVLVSRDILDYAVDCTSFLSYNVISELAQAVEEVFGSTGLDPLLESTLVGNSKKALEELRKKNGILMTTSEKLAFFFSAAFCSSDVVEAFKEKGADISATDAAGNNILQIAEKYGNSENVRYAHEQGIN